MKNLMSGLASAFSKQTPPNPDPGHNVYLLKDAKGLIESGTFTHYFKKSFLVVMEVISYSVTVFLFVAGTYLFFKIKTLFSILINTAVITQSLASENVDVESLEFVELGIYILLFLPFIISILWARGYTKSRRRVNIIKRVEGIITEVIANLSAAIKKES